MYQLNLQVFANGADGGVDLAKAVVNAVENGNANYKRLYSDDDHLKKKSLKSLLKSTVVTKLSSVKKLKTN